MLERIPSAIKEFFDLRTDVVVTLCITSALFLWVMPLEEYEAMVTTVASVCFVLTSVYLLVRLALYGYRRYSRNYRQFACLRNLKPEEKAFLTYYIERDKAVQPGRGSIVLLLEKKRIIEAISLIPSERVTVYALNDWARQLLTKHPRLLVSDKS